MSCAPVCYLGISEAFKAHTLVRHLSGGIYILSPAIRDKGKGALMKRKKNIRRLLCESFERGTE